MLRNKEIRRFLACFVTLGAIFTAASFALQPLAGLLMLFSTAVFGTAFFLFTGARYRSIAHISKQIDLVLHNVDRLELDAFDEGELSILYNEVSKMTLRIREQNDALKRDKQYLADSLADIAHQLRTPLTSATLILSFLAKNPDQQQRQTFVHELQALLVRMDWLITSLLKLSRLDAGVVAFQREALQVTALIQGALRPLEIPLELRNIVAQVDIPKDAVILGDLGWLIEAVENILKNCMESIAENGTIRLHCADTALFTQLTVHDSGAG